jgi:zinc finger protein
MDTVNAEKIDKFLENLKSYLEGNRFPLTLELEDPSGNSFVKNPYAPSDDP